MIGWLTRRLRDWYQCPEMAHMGLNGNRHYQCQLSRDHSGLHYSAVGRIEMVQWPTGWANNYKETA